MTHKRSLNFTGYFAPGQPTKQLIYQPGTLDSAHKISGRLYYGGIMLLVGVARIAGDKNLQFFLQTTQGEHPLTDLIPFSPGIGSKNLREVITQSRTGIPFKMGSDARLSVECLDGFLAGEWLVIQGIGDELGEDLTAV